MSQEKVERILEKLLSDRNFFYSCCRSLEQGGLKKGLQVMESELSILEQLTVRNWLYWTLSLTGLQEFRKNLILET